MLKFFGIVAISLSVYVLIRWIKQLKTEQSSYKGRNKPYTKPEEKTKYVRPPAERRVVNFQESSNYDELYEIMIGTDDSTNSKTEELFDSLVRNEHIDPNRFESLRTLLKDSIKHYNEFKGCDYIPKPSLPILFFGDVEQYSKGSFRIVTAALNPSDIEFRKTKSNKSFSFFRFPFYQEGSEKTLYISLRDYFNINPYNRWFDSSYKDLLKGMGYSFYNDDLNTVIHTDVVSPLATNPTWSDLLKRKKTDNSILKLESIGLKLWKELIEVLKPDLILMSLAESHLGKLDLEYISKFDIITTTDGNQERKKPYVSNLYRLKLEGYSCYLLHSPSANTPFGLISKNQKIKLGEKLKRELIDKPIDEICIQNSTNEKSISNSEVIVKKNFVLSKNLRGEGVLIQLGEGKSKIIYDHDLLLDDLGDRITELPCWKKYGYYTKTGGSLPKFCKNRRAILIDMNN
jgi:hypothetical protein